MKKNVASQVIGAQMVTASDGSAFTSAVTVYVTGDGGTQAVGSVGSGACTHEGNGFHSYAPAQAETNYDHVAFTFIGTGAVPATVQVFTQFPQTGDSYARLGAPAGASVSADVAAVKTQTAAIETDTQDLQTQVGTAGAGLTNIGTIATCTNLTNLPTIPSNWITAAGIAASAMNGKGDWNVGKTGYSLTQSFPTNFADLSISATTGLVDITQAAADKAWGTAARTLTANTNLNDPTAAAIADAVWDELQSAHVSAGSFGEIATEIAAILVDSNAVDTDLADGGRLDLLIDAIKAKTDSLTYTVAGQVDANVQSVNDVTITGNGSTTPFNV